MVHNEEKYDKAMSKILGIISKFVLDQYQPIIKRKTSQEA